MKPEEFSKILSVLTDPVFLLTANGDIAMANNMASNLLCVDNRELINKNISELVIPQQKKKSQRFFSDLSESNDKKKTTLTFNCEKQAYECYCYVSYTKDIDGDGMLVLHIKDMIGISGGDYIDSTSGRGGISANKVLDNEEHLRLLVNSAGEAIYSIDMNGRL